VKNWLSRLTQDWRGELAALISGALVPLAFAPVDIFPLVFFSIALLFFLFESTESLSRVFLRGYLFGIGYFGFGVTWVSISMVRFGGMSFILSVALTALLVIVLAFYIGGIGYLSRKFFSKASSLTHLLLIFPALWVLLEWVRGWLFTGFPWIDIGYSQVLSPLSSWFPVVVVYGVTLSVVIIAGCVTALLYVKVEQRKWLGLGVAGFVLLSGLLSFVPWAQPVGKSLKASLIQGNVPQEIEWAPSQRQPTIDLYSQLTFDNWDSDIIIWPETALPAYCHQAEGFLKSLALQANEKNTSMLIGLPSAKTINGEKSYYNSAVILDQGELQIYNKYHLVPFGEYIPLKWLLGDLLGFMNIPMANFKNSSEHQPVVNMAGLKGAVSICYEDVFGEEVINGLPDANFLINISNDAWFGDSLAPHQHLQKARARSLETARPMLRSTNNGISAVIDHKANILATSPQFQQHVLSVNFQPMQGATLYVMVGNYLMLMVIAIMLFFGWRGGR
jgi:apolipoprotein N-acyltransferase